jgi:hypothetical protein
MRVAPVRQVHDGRLHLFHDLRYLGDEGGHGAIPVPEGVPQTPVGDGASEAAELGEERLVQVEICA